MDEVQVILPAELLAAAGVNPADPSKDAAMLLALGRAHQLELLSDLYGQIMIRARSMKR